eukprot:7904592-Pyramimonas_sp.AAC.1
MVMMSSSAETSRFKMKPKLSSMQPWSGPPEPIGTSNVCRNIVVIVSAGTIGKRSGIGKTAGP